MKRLLLWDPPFDPPALPTSAERITACAAWAIRNGCPGLLRVSDPPLPTDPADDWPAYDLRHLLLLAQSARAGLLFYSPDLLTNAATSRTELARLRCVPSGRPTPLYTATHGPVRITATGQLTITTGYSLQAQAVWSPIPVDSRRRG
jgi:hypothetical protein